MYFIYTNFRLYNIGCVNPHATKKLLMMRTEIGGHHITESKIHGKLILRGHSRWTH